MAEQVNKKYKRSNNSALQGCVTLFAIIAMVVGTIVITSWAIRNIPFISEPIQAMVC